MSKAARYQLLSSFGFLCRLTEGEIALTSEDWRMTSIKEPQQQTDQHQMHIAVALKPEPCLGREGNRDLDMDTC